MILRNRAAIIIPAQALLFAWLILGYDALADLLTALRGSQSTRAGCWLPTAGHNSAARVTRADCGPAGTAGGSDARNPVMRISHPRANL